MQCQNPFQVLRQLAIFAALARRDGRSYKPTERNRKASPALIKCSLVKTSRSDFFPHFGETNRYRYFISRAPLVSPPVSIVRKHGGRRAIFMADFSLDPLVKMIETTSRAAKGAKAKRFHEKSASSDDQSVSLTQRRSKLLRSVGGLSKLKARQRSKIAEIRIALVEAGFVTLNEQVTALGLSRSTACSILKPGHKSSGLEARTIGRILRSPRLPGRVRQRILENMQEKIEGCCGHTERRRREFAKCLKAAPRNE